MPFPLTSIRRDWTLFFLGLRRRQRPVGAAQAKCGTLGDADPCNCDDDPRRLLAANLVYQVVRKPTEMFFPVSGAMNKTPAETWRQYGPLFREYSTTSITPELLAALAQVEGAGNPVARTYWQWRLTWNPVAIYQPASSAVGMYQMTDAAFAEARRYCIRHILSSKMVAG